MLYSCSIPQCTPLKRCHWFLAPGMNSARPCSWAGPPPVSSSSGGRSSAAIAPGRTQIRARGTRLQATPVSQAETMSKGGGGRNQDYLVTPTHPRSQVVLPVLYWLSPTVYVLMCFYKCVCFLGFFLYIGFVFHSQQDFRGIMEVNKMCVWREHLFNKL